MDDTPAVSFQTKAIRGHVGRPTRGKEWVAATRGRLTITDAALTLGDARFAVEEISQPVLWQVRCFLFWRMPLLEFHHDDTPYQFGFNPWAKVAEALPFDAEARPTTVAWSWWSVGYRLVVWGVAAVLIALVLTR